jgi:hypothetical protein
MKKIFLIVAVVSLTLFTSCSIKTSDKVDIDTDKITYIKDVRTGLCFGVVASRKAGEASSTGLGVTCVPCEMVEKYLEKN